jgi:hypothetical protein
VYQDRRESIVSGFTRRLEARDSGKKNIYPWFWYELKNTGQCIRIAGPLGQGASFLSEGVTLIAGDFPQQSSARARHHAISTALQKSELGPNRKPLLYTRPGHGARIDRNHAMVYLWVTLRMSRWEEWQDINNIPYSGISAELSHRVSAGSPSAP